MRIEKRALIGAAEEEAAGRPSIVTDGSTIRFFWSVKATLTSCPIGSFCHGSEIEHAASIINVAVARYFEYIPSPLQPGGLKGCPL